MCLQDADACWCMCITSCMSVLAHAHSHVCASEWVDGTDASEPEPVGIRKVDLGHKYLISVCCPWKSSIYSWPDGKTRLGDRSPSLVDKKEMQPKEAATRRTLTWCGWKRKEATLAGGGKNKMFISFWWKVITRKLQMDSFQKPSHCLFGQKRTVIRYEKKLSQTVKYWILCVWYRLTVKQNKYQPKIASLDTAATQKSFP